MKKFWIIGVALLTLVSFFMTGCDSDGDGGGSSSSSGSIDCNCEDKPIIEDDGLVFTFEKRIIKKPSNVSVFFKVETDTGEPVPNLVAEDFKIFENDSQISSFESQQAIMPKPEDFSHHTLLVLDLSGSVLGSESLTKLKNAAQGFITAVTDASVNNDIYLSVKWFDGAARLHSLVDFTNKSEKLIAGIDSISEDISNDPSTNLYGAIIEGIDIVEKITNTPDAVNSGAVVIFTDGKDQASRKTRDEAFDAVMDAEDHIKIYTIGLGGEIDETVLKSVGKDGFAFASDFAELVPKFKEIAVQINKEVNSHYLLEYCSPKRNGEHTLKIEVEDGEQSGSLTTCFCAGGFEGGCEISE
ncbi:VWA domain-containing protein [Desulfobacterales bacterium HSG16]|nr:VWA domain-containing protein [Desulfobacterales bacterium HSG16]